MNTDGNEPQKPKLWQIVMSVLGAAFGVQSERTRKRDFEHGKPAAYIIAGLIFTVLFVLILVFVVSMVLDQASIK